MTRDKLTEPKKELFYLIKCFKLHLPRGVSFLFLNLFIFSTYNKHLNFLCMGDRGRVAQWLRCSVTNRKVAGSIPAGVSGFFIDIKSFRSHYGPGFVSASNINEYQEHFLGVKAAGT